MIRLADSIDPDPKAQQLLANLKRDRDRLSTTLADADQASEDLLYRFWHQSFKVYAIQGSTERMVETLRAAHHTPGDPLDPWFEQIITEGTGREFSIEDNARWLQVGRPMVEAWFHTHWFVEQALRYADELDHPPRMLPSGWAAILCLYRLR